MKKKLFCLLLILILPVCFLFSGCNRDIKSSNTMITFNVGNIELIKIEQVGIGNGDELIILVDKQTRVMYLLICSYNGNHSGLTVMLDANGKPLIFEGELN
nr:MAG TPA: protein of unknown function (DUF5016) [Caudoviricetes sp.]